MSQYARDAVFALSETFVFAVPVYILGGISRDQVRAVNFFILVLMTGYCTTCQNVLVQIDVQNVRLGASIQIGLLAVGSLFNGFIVQLDQLPPYFKWIPYIMLSFYGFAGALLNELSDFSLPCSGGELECGVRTGDVILRILSYDSLDVYICMVCLMAMIIIFRILAAADFYYRFGRQTNMKRVGSGDRKADKREMIENFENEENRKAGKAIGNILDSAVTPVGLKRQASGTSPNIDSLSQFVLNKPEQNEKKEKKQQFYIDEETGMQYEINYDDDDTDFADDDSVNEANQTPQNEDLEGQSLVTRMLLSRIFLVAVFLSDMLVTGYICLPFERVFFIIILIIFAGIYGVQFFFQFLYLIPYTANTGTREFVWASEYDFPSFVLFLGDVSLSVQALQFGVDSDSSLADNTTLQAQLLLILAVKVVRVFRIQLYWKKVNKLHKVRSITLGDEAKRLLAEREAEGKDEQDRINQQIGRFSGADIHQQANRLSARLVLNRLTNKSLQSDDSQGRKRRNRRSNRFSNIFNKSQGDSTSRNSKRGSNRLSNRFSLNLFGRNSKRYSNKLKPETQWQKYKNPKTGEMLYYNPVTNETRSDPPPGMEAVGAPDGTLPSL